MICKWQTDCARCGIAIEVDEELFFATGLLGEKEKICWLCAYMDGLICECGNQKKQQYTICYTCKQEVNNE